MAGLNFSLPNLNFMGKVVVALVVITLIVGIALPQFGIDVKKWLFGG